MHTAAQVLLVAPTVLSFLHLIHRLERRQCRWRLATTWEEAEHVLAQERYDLVLATQSPGPTRLQHLKTQTNGRLPTVFQAVPVEDSSWWVPLLEDGQPATNLPALRPSEFAGYLERLLDQLCSTHPTAAEKEQASAASSSEKVPVAAVEAKASE